MFLVDFLQGMYAVVIAIRETKGEVHYVVLCPAASPECLSLIHMILLQYCFRSQNLGAERERTDHETERTSWGKFLIFPTLHSKRKTVTVKQAISVP